MVSEHIPASCIVPRHTCLLWCWARMTSSALCTALMELLLPHDRYIRYIFNRIILENATVRAAAVTALAQFGAKCPALQQRVLLLLKRALYDNDDEVGILGCPTVQSMHTAQKGATSAMDSSSVSTALYGERVALCGVGLRELGVSSSLRYQHCFCCCSLHYKLITLGALLVCRTASLEAAPLL